MCWKKLFGGGGVDPILGNKVLLSFAINDYPGSANDLNGCLNDQINIEKTLLKYWPDFEVRKFADSQVTKRQFRDQLTEALKQTWDSVIMIMDCCFSEDNTKGLTTWDVRERFVRPQGLKRAKIRRHLARSTNMTWIAFSACQDFQTASDAYISGSYSGAFTYFAMKALKSSMTYREWYQKTKELLEQNNFEQIPELQGPDSLLDKKVFSDNCLVVHYSGHGTFTKDTSGDEADQQDEAMYLYDGIFLDDDLCQILSVIT